jgi:hypothetical protein
MVKLGRQNMMQSMIILLSIMSGRKGEAGLITEKISIT